MSKIRAIVHIDDFKKAVAAATDPTAKEFEVDVTPVMPLPSILPQERQDV